PLPGQQTGHRIGSIRFQLLCLANGILQQSGEGCRVGRRGFARTGNPGCFLCRGNIGYHPLRRGLNIWMRGGVACRGRIRKKGMTAIPKVQAAAQRMIPNVASTKETAGISGASEPAPSYSTPFAGLLQDAIGKTQQLETNASNAVTGL